MSALVVLEDVHGDVGCLYHYETDDLQPWEFLVSDEEPLEQQHSEEENEAVLSNEQTFECRDLVRVQFGN